ncbi:hypothetical protein LTR53_010224 [Teratosphaeriaceae sp. CCFEE 6253]|nr:hypothetical protein LTR53_010224 [Teratosphaeriaceae sp. CCFEE 6253]
MTFEMLPGFSDRHQFDGDAAAMEAAVQQFERDGTGPLTVHYGSVPLAFFRLDNLSKRPTFGGLGEDVQELLMRPTVPHYEFAMCGPLLPFGSVELGGDGGYFNFFVALQNAQARGSVTLSSSNPADPPLINPNYLGHEHDRAVLAEGTAATLAYMRTPTMQKYLKRAIHAPKSPEQRDIDVSYPTIADPECSQDPRATQLTAETRSSSKPTWRASGTPAAPWRWAPRTTRTPSSTPNLSSTVSGTCAWRT